MSDKLPSSLHANPHYYDYLYGFTFEPNSQVEIIDGAGQVINADIRGRYRAEATTDDAILELHLFDPLI